LLTAYAAGLSWMLALALVDGVDGIGAILDHPGARLLASTRRVDQMAHPLSGVTRTAADDSLMKQAVPG
jgi:hypothetical protein